MRIFFYIFCLLFLSLSSAYGNPFMVVADKRKADANCSSWTVDQEYDISDTNKSLTIDAYGQAFQVSRNGKMASISIYIGYVGSPGTVTLRWGATPDLSAVYYEEIISTEISAIGWTEIVLVGNDSILSGTTYYFAVIENSGDIRWAADQNTAAYANGAYWNGVGFNLTTETTTRDFRFRVSLCD